MNRRPARPTSPDPTSQTKPRAGRAGAFSGTSCCSGPQHAVPHFPQTVTPERGPALSYHDVGGHNHRVIAHGLNEKHLEASKEGSGETTDVTHKVGMAGSPPHPRTPPANTQTPKANHCSLLSPSPAHALAWVTPHTPTGQAPSHAAAAAGREPGREQSRHRPGASGAFPAPRAPEPDRSSAHLEVIFFGKMKDHVSPLPGGIGGIEHLTGRQKGSEGSPSGG